MAIGDRIKHAAHSAEEAARREAAHVVDNVKRLGGGISQDLTQTTNTITNALDIMAGSQDIPSNQPIITGNDETDPYPGSMNGLPSSNAVVKASQASNGFLGSLVKETEHVISTVTSPILDYADDIHKAVQDVGKSVTETADNAFDTLKNIPGDIKTEVGKAFDTTEDKAKSAAEKAKAKLQDIRDHIEKPFEDFGADVWKDLKYVLLFGGVGLLLLWNGSSGARHEAVSWVKKTGKRTFDELGEAIPKVASALPTVVAAAPLLL